MAFPCAKYYELSQVLAHFAFRHAELYDFAELSGTLAYPAPYLLPSRSLDPANPRTLPPKDYGLDGALFALSSNPHGTSPKSRFSMEVESFVKPPRWSLVRPASTADATPYGENQAEKSRPRKRRR